MDYEKILKRIVQIINTTENSDIGFTNICTYIGENCPELQKSEDERIRKELIDYINRLTVTPNNIDRYNSWIAWLEKQGEKFIPEDINKAALQYVDTCAVDGEITHDNITEPYWNNHSMINAYKAGWLEKQAPQEIDGFDSELNALLKKYEHLPKEELQEPLEFYLGVVRDDLDVVRADKPKWSEEDEENYKDIIGVIHSVTYQTYEDEVARLNWIKSIKQRLGGEE